MRRLWVIAALAAASVHCGGDDSPPDPATVDADGDGVFASEDCDDAAGDRWRRLPGFRDADGDLVGGGAQVQVCTGEALRAGWVTAGGDCDDANPTRFSLGEAYRDADGDGAAEEPLASVCMGGVLPEGWAETPADCAPGDASRWQELGYLYRDGDGDGLTAARAGTVCSGSTLPAGHAMEPAGDDCDDANPAVFARTDAFVDGDRDGVGTDPGTVCAGDALPIGWSTLAGDCDDGDPARFESMSAYADQDRDGVGAEALSVCVGASGLPAGTTITSGDCDDAEPRAWENRTAHRDGDGDGRGLEGGSVCGSPWWLPPGWSTDGTDCDDANPSAWALQAYQYADRDGDGRALVGAATVCAAALPPELRTALGDWFAGDCDDADPERWWAVTLYADVDADGWGAGPSSASCVGATVPAGMATSGSDCAPEDATRWALASYRSRDADGDGRAVPAVPSNAYSSGNVCTGAALPAGYTTAVASAPYDCDDANEAIWGLRQGAPDEDGDGWGAGPLAAVCSGAALPAGYGAHGNDCAVSDPSLWRWTVLYPDADGDGVGAPPREVQCLGATVPPGWSEKGWDSNDTDPGVQGAAGDEEPLALEL